MDKIAWCFDQGMELIEPDKNLAEAYINKALKSLQTMNEVSSNEWKCSAGYYAMYFSLYAVLIRIGINSEIHDCTLAVMEHILTDYYNEDDINILNIAKKMRIDSLYYASKPVPEVLMHSILTKTEYFIQKSRNIVSMLSQLEISALRSTLRKILDPR